MQIKYKTGAILLITVASILGVFIFSLYKKTPTSMTTKIENDTPIYTCNLVSKDRFFIFDSTTLHEGVTVTIHIGKLPNDLQVITIESTQECQLSDNANLEEELQRP